MGPLETYLKDLRDTKLSGEGVSELSYYPALRDLLEEVGGGLKPKVRCFMNLKNHGAGLPDGGLFTADQVRGTRAAKAAAAAVAGDVRPGRSRRPEAGPRRHRGQAAQRRRRHHRQRRQQVLGYLEAYRQVLVTNLREFLLLGIDEHGHAGHPRTLQPGADRGRVLGPGRPSAPRRAGAGRALPRVPQAGAALRGHVGEPAGPGLVPGLVRARGPLPDRVGRAAGAGRRAQVARRHPGRQVRGGKGRALFPFDSGADPVLRPVRLLGPVESRARARRRGAQRFDWTTAAWTLRVPVVQALFTQIATPQPVGLAGTGAGSRSGGRGAQPGR